MIRTLDTNNYRKICQQYRRSIWMSQNLGKQSKKQPSENCKQQEWNSDNFPTHIPKPPYPTRLEPKK